MRQSLSAVVRLALGSAEHRVLLYVDDVVPLDLHVLPQTQLDSQI